MMTSISMGIFIISILIKRTQGDLNMNLMGFGTWSESFGQSLYDVCSKSTALTDLKADYLILDPKVTKINGSRLLEEMNEKMSSMLAKKVKSVSDLVMLAERLFSEYQYDHEIKLTYHNSKKLNFSEIELQYEERFPNIPISLLHSTIHVPTNVYNNSTVILNGVLWTDQLNGAFINNFRVDPTATWQYFCSSNGFLRFYPGTTWETLSYKTEKIDTFDCRVRDWYLQAAAYPKDLIILLDVSGSMRGLRNQIAKATVHKILDTLNDDDFFNIIKYTDTVEYLSDCFNGTLIQATDSNKIVAKNAAETIMPQGIAHLDEALITAFELLKAMNESKKGALCNKAIMVVTDGAIENYKHIFEKYNWPDMHIRLFTYLIGREVGDSQHLKWMACNNKGRFSHITSLADVHEHVQEYIHVISRPMVISKSNHVSWTNVYSDSHDPGLSMMTTVSQAVYDKRPEMHNKGVLLGVMGTDIPLDEMTKHFPAHKIGVNGYPFAITPNGYTLFHPRLKPRQPNLSDNDGAYNAVDLSDLEVSDVEHKLRTAMVNRRSGHLQMKSIVTFDRGLRAKERDSTYFYTEVKRTPFSVAISLPDKYGHFKVESNGPSDFSDLSALSSSDILIAPWPYCQNLTGHHDKGALTTLLQILKEYKNRPKELYSICDRELLESLLFDAEATRGLTASWYKENWMGLTDASEASSPNKNGIELVFIGTKGGLTRYLKLSQLTDPDFLQTITTPIESTYYQRAADTDEVIFTFSIPFNHNGTQNMFDCVLTASTPILINDDDNVAVAAVVGLQMKYSYFYDLFMKTPFDPKFDPSIRNSLLDLNLTCDNPSLYCYLLDENGYIILSENPEEVGRFFGFVNNLNSFMSRLIYKEGGDNEDEDGEGGGVENFDDASSDNTFNEDHKWKLFKKLHVIETQATCRDSANLGSTATNIIVQPLCFILNGVTWLMGLTYQVIVSLLTTQWWFELQSFLKALDIHDMDNSSVMAAMYDEGYHPVVHNKLTECEQKIEDDQAKKICLENVAASIGIMVERPCINLVSHYEADMNVLPFHGTPPPCEDGGSCVFSANRVPGTNLIMLMIESECSCRKTFSFISNNKEIKSENIMCEKIKSSLARKVPSECVAYHTKENYTECGGSSRMQQTILLLISMQTFLILHFIFVAS